MSESRQRFLLNEMTSEMPANHACMGSAGSSVRLLTSKNLGDESGDMIGVMRIHSSKHRSEDRVFWHFFIEAGGKVLDIRQSAAPFQQGRYRLRCHRAKVP
jgi:hypothetical protein